MRCVCILILFLGLLANHGFPQDDLDVPVGMRDVLEMLPQWDYRSIKFSNLGGVKSLEPWQMQFMMPGFAYRDSDPFSHVARDALWYVSTTASESKFRKEFKEASDIEQPETSEEIKKLMEKHGFPNVFVMQQSAILAFYDLEAKTKELLEAGILTRTGQKLQDMELFKCAVDLPGTRR